MELKLIKGKLIQGNIIVLQGISLSENNVCDQDLWLPYSAHGCKFLSGMLAIVVGLCKLPASWWPADIQDRFP